MPTFSNGQPVEPLVSIITPCLNAGRFLEEAVQSVLSQDYPNIEYIVADGGSTDGTIAFLESRGSRLKWFTGRDSGTAEAINRGFQRSAGEILGFLNADDRYLPGAVSAAVRGLLEDPEAGGVYGDAWWIDESSSRIGPYPVKDFSPALLGKECFICHPASFVRRSAFESLGGMNPACDVTFDYEFWIRFARRYRLRRIGATLAESRMHRGNKTLGQRESVFEETFSIFKKHFGYVPFGWIYAYLCFREDRRDQFFEPLEPSISAYAKSLPFGLWTNPTHPLRYVSEWAEPISWEAFGRRVRLMKKRESAVMHPPADRDV